MDWQYGFFLTLVTVPYILNLECGEFTPTNNILETRIVNGELAALGEFPWQVSLQRKVRIKLESSNVTSDSDDDQDLIFHEMDEDLIRTNSLWNELLKANNITEEQVFQWPHQFPPLGSNISTMYPPSQIISIATLPTRFPPLPTFPPNHVFPPMPTVPPSHIFPPIPTLPPSHIFPPKQTLPPSHIFPPIPTIPPSHIFPPKSTPPPSSTTNSSTQHTFPPIPTLPPIQVNPPKETLPPMPVNPPKQTHPPSHVFPPLPTLPPSHIFPPISIRPPSSVNPPLPTLPPSHIFPPVSIRPPPELPKVSNPPIVTPAKHWTQWPWSTTRRMPTMPPPIPTSKIPTWSTPSSRATSRMPPIILPIPTSPPRPKPRPHPQPQPQPQPHPQPRPQPPRPNPETWQWRWQHFCGGSIINHYWIMTAAHCVEGLKNTYTPGMIQIIAGSTNWRVADNPYAQVISVDRIIVHEGWRQVTGQNDIALLHLAKPISYVKQDKIYINNVCLSQETQKEYDGIASSSGWGFLSKDNRVTPELLRRVDLLVVDHLTCRNAFSRVIAITPDQVCAGRSPKGNCMGDSGGPLIQKYGNRATQIGIVSFSIPCAVPGYPDVFTRVSKYIDWISMKTGLNFHVK